MRFQALQQQHLQHQQHQYQQHLYAQQQQQQQVSVRVSLIGRFTVRLHLIGCLFDEVQCSLRISLEATGPEVSIYGHNRIVDLTRGSVKFRHFVSIQIHKSQNKGLSHSRDMWNFVRNGGSTVLYTVFELFVSSSFMKLLLISCCVFLYSCPLVPKGHRVTVAGELEFCSLLCIQGSSVTHH